MVQLRVLPQIGARVGGGEGCGPLAGVAAAYAGQAMSPAALALTSGLPVSGVPQLCMIGVGIAQDRALMVSDPPIHQPLQSP